MTIYRLPERIPMSLPDTPIALALGNFDGVHTGHRRLLAAARAAAETIPGCLAGAWTFTTLAKEVADVPALTTAEEKLRQFANAGLDFAILEEFSAVRDLSPEEFARTYLTDKLGCAAVVCGFNFRFGRGGAGDCRTLRAILSEGDIPLTVVDPVMHGDLVVSSTCIRAAVEAGDMDRAAALLGRPFSVCFPVRHGKQLGRTIGLPTINQDFPVGHIVPRHGIYACICTVGSARYMGVANVGVRPSVVSDGHVNCETHIIDYDGLLYGESIRVEFLTRLRDEIRFDSIDALREAIEADIGNARAYFAAHPFCERTIP